VQKKRPDLKVLSLNFKMMDKLQTNIEELLSVGITTKGRIHELRDTLKILEKSELRACTVILIDDGGCGDFIHEEDFDLNLVIHRYQESQGLVARRNELAELCQTKYLMSLDDDSAPESGSIVEVLNVLEAEDSTVTAALNLYNDTTQHIDRELPDFDARDFVGCGYIHNVDTFRKLGGYTGDLFYGHEEREYALKIARASKKIVHMNNYIVKHRKSEINRVVGYNPRLSRNLGWINGTYLGLLPNIIELYSFLKVKKLNQVAPALTDYFKGLSARRQASKLTFSQYWHWKRKKTPTVA